ncbi:hypothetical protein G6F22_017721 [Rhizopus arrhizus]|nr:hypothetical protein G6F24_018369 [Rhizopus arrhizus]KAG0767016.1 hypothetical protein G6F22_017721 [Rhizopus arrhizus]
MPNPGREVASACRFPWCPLIPAVVFASGGGHREGPAYPWHAAVAPCGRLWAGVGGWPGVGVGGARARAAAGSGPGGASAHARRRTPGRSL